MAHFLPPSQGIVISLGRARPRIEHLLRGLAGMVARHSEGVPPFKRETRCLRTGRNFLSAGLGDPRSIEHFLLYHPDMLRLGIRWEIGRESENRRRHRFLSMPQDHQSPIS